MNQKTRTGAQMKPETLEKIVSVMTTPGYDGLKQMDIAKKCRLSITTIRNYLTEDVWAEIRRRRLQIMGETLSMVDKAVLTKALGGDLAAAKLIYSRWDDDKKNADVKEALVNTGAFVAAGDLDASSSAPCVGEGRFSNLTSLDDIEKALDDVTEKLSKVEEAL